MKTFKEYSLLNESSTISALGATKEQIKTIYGSISKKWSEVVPDANAKFTAKTKKKEVTDLMRSKGANAVVVVGFDGAMMYFAIQTQSKGWDYKKDEYKIYQIGADGSKVAEWTESSAIKALSYFKGVKTYYISEKGATVAQPTSKHGYDDRANGNDVAYELSKLIEKDMKVLFEKAKVLFTTKITKKINKGDLVGAMNMLDKIVDDKSQSNWRHEYVEKEFSDFMKDTSGWDSKSIYQQIKDAVAKKENGYVPSGFGSIPAIDKFTTLATPQEIRQAAAEVLREVKEKITAIIED
jgi:hypothetical protein